MRKLVLGTLALITLISFSGCIAGKRGDACLANIEGKNISKMIIKGSTTKNDIRKAFGNPSSSSFTSQGERWSYSFTKNTLDAGNFIPYTGNLVGGSKHEMKMLTVMFKDDVVDDYSYHESGTVEKSVVDSIEAAPPTL